MAAPIALIQGASRGLGLEFCKHILRNKNPAAVIATCRSPDGATELRRVAEQHPGRVTVLRLDVDREEDVRSAAARVKESFGRLDLLVNSSAMLHPSGKGETSLRDVSAQVKHTVTVAMWRVMKDILHIGLVPSIMFNLYMFYNHRVFLKLRLSKVCVQTSVSFIKWVRKWIACTLNAVLTVYYYIQTSSTINKNIDY